MITALVAIEVDREKIHAAAEQLTQMEVVHEVYSVTGRWDLMAEIHSTDSRQ